MGGEGEECGGGGESECMWLSMGKGIGAERFRYLPTPFDYLVKPQNVKRKPGSCPCPLKFANSTPMPWGRFSLDYWTMLSCLPRLLPLTYLFSASAAVNFN